MVAAWEEKRLGRTTARISRNNRKPQRGIKRASVLETLRGARTSRGTAGWPHPKLSATSSGEWLLQVEAVSGRTFLMSFYGNVANGAGTTAVGVRDTTRIASQPPDGKQRAAAEHRTAIASLREPRRHSNSSIGATGKKNTKGTRPKATECAPATPAEAPAPWPRKNP